MLVRTPNLLTLHSIVICNFICFVVVVGPFALQSSGSCGRLGTPAEGGVFKTNAPCHSQWLPNLSKETENLTSFV